MDYRLVCLDIDGTTANSHGKISSYTKETIHKAIKKGIPVCLVTGRNLRNAMQAVKMLDIDTLLVTSDGGVIYDIKNKKIVRQLQIDKEEIRKMSKIADKYDVYMEFCTTQKYVKYIKEPSLLKYSYGGIPENPAQGVKFYFQGLRKYSSLDKIFNKYDNIDQFLVGGKKEEVKAIYDEIKTEDLTDIIIRDDLWENYLFVVHKDSTKSTGVSFLCDYYGISMDEVIAMGDQMNDVDMIQKAGLGIAMGNAHDTIKEIANDITDTNDNDGVAKALYKYLDLD